MDKNVKPKSDVCSKWCNEILKNISDALDEAYGKELTSIKVYIGDARGGRIEWGYYDEITNKPLYGEHNRPIGEKELDYIYAYLNLHGYSCSKVGGNRYLSINWFAYLR